MKFIAIQTLVAEEAGHDHVILVTGIQVNSVLLAHLCVGTLAK